MKRRLEASMPARSSGSTSLASAPKSIAPANANVPPRTRWMLPSHIQASPATAIASAKIYGT
jgi:hypothetical protein